MEENKEEQQKAQQAGNNAARIGIKAASRFYGGQLGGKVADAALNTKLGQNIVNQTGKNLAPVMKNKQLQNTLNKADSLIDKISRYKLYISIGAGASIGCFGFLVIICIIAIILSPILYVKEMINNGIQNVSDFFKGVGYWFTTGTFCSSEEECNEIEKNNFYQKIVDVSNEYNLKYSIELDVSLITSTLTYYSPMANDDEDEDEDSNPTDAIDFKKSEKKIKLLASKLVSDGYYCTSDTGEVKTYAKDDFESCPNASDIQTEGKINDYDKYREYLDEFVRDYYFKGRNDSDTDKKVENAINEIFSRAEFASNITISNPVGVKIYGYCSGVTVTDKDGNVEGIYSLEDYIKGVVEKEAFRGQGIEAYKAQAIAARTYLLVRTNNCTTPIKNSTDDQVFSPDYDEDSDKSKAVEETEGLVLTYEGKIFSSEYDSFCADDDCETGVVTDENGNTIEKWAIYTKKPTQETHKVTITNPDLIATAKSGHGRGMSQIASYQMAREGATYEEILKYFYADGVQIVNMVTRISGKYTTSSKAPIDAFDLRIRSDRYRSNPNYMINSKIYDLSRIYNSQASNLGQCVWYAKSRALEIIINSSMSEPVKERAYKAILNTNANGEGWFDADTLKDNFSYSKNIYDAKEGAIISWSGGTCDERTCYGHVAIVESVDKENGLVTISEGWNSSGPNGETTWNNVNYRKITMTFHQLKIYNSAKDYQFNGYIYILG